MRIILFTAMLVAASPALGQTAPQSAPQKVEIPAEFSDPATAEKLSRVMQALSRSFLELPVGEIEAAIEGREPTAADKKKTVRTEGRRDDPNFDAKFQQQMAQSKPMMEAALKALSAALPALMQSMEPVREALERATVNMPSPTYPKR